MNAKKVMWSCGRKVGQTQWMFVAPQGRRAWLYLTGSAACPAWGSEVHEAQERVLEQMSQAYDVSWDTKIQKDDGRCLWLDPTSLVVDPPGVKA